MPSRAQTAGIIALVSLLVPWTIFFDAYGSGFTWTIGGFEFYSGGAFFFDLTTFFLLDAILSVLVLVILLAGAVILISSRQHSRIGASLVLLAIAVAVINIVYDEFAYSSFLPIPVGLILALVAGIVGFSAKPLMPMGTAARQTESSLDRLAKLKELLDAGAITKEEFEEQKKRLLQSGEE